MHYIHHSQTRRCVLFDKFDFNLAKKKWEKNHKNRRKTISKAPGLKEHINTICVRTARKMRFVLCYYAAGVPTSVHTHMQYPGGPPQSIEVILFLCLFLLHFVSMFQFNWICSISFNNAQHSYTDYVYICCPHCANIYLQTGNCFIISIGLHKSDVSW